MANQEKKMEKSELYGVNAGGATTAAVFRTQFDLQKGAVTSKFESLNSQQTDSFGYKFNADMASTLIHEAGQGHTAYGMLDGFKQVAGLVGSGGVIVGAAEGLKSGLQGLRSRFLNGSPNHPNANNIPQMASTPSLLLARYPPLVSINPSGCLPELLPQGQGVLYQKRQDLQVR